MREQSHQEGHTSVAEPYETTRHEGDNPGSCFVEVAARAMVRGGRHVVTGTSCGDLLVHKFRELCFPGKEEVNAKKIGHPL